MTAGFTETAPEVLTLLPDEIRDRTAFISGETHPELGAAVADLLGIEVTPVEFKRFADTEGYVRIQENVRKKDIIAFQTHAPVDGRPTSDSIYQHFQMLDAAARSHANDIIAVVPHLSGARQDRQVLAREAISAKLNLKLLGAAGASELVTVDIHDIHTLNDFHTTPDHLTAQPMLRDMLGRLMTGDPEGYVLVAPDEGHAKTLRPHAKHLGIELKDMVKARDPHGERVTHEGTVDGVDGRVCFLMDDMLSTGSTLISAAENLNESGAAEIYAAFTHGSFSGQAVELLKASPITKLFVTDTVPIRQEVLDILNEHGTQDRLVIVSAAALLAGGVRRILTGESVDDMHSGQHLH
jgi:ribose-phosphate pyrophosphokinase